MLEATKTMRYTRGARNLYGRLRGRERLKSSPSRERLG